MTFYNFSLNDHSFAHLLKFIFPLSHALDRAMSTVSISETQEISLVSKKYTLPSIRVKRGLNTYQE